MSKLSAFLLLFLSTGIAAQQFNLVKEINTTANGNAIASSLMARVGSTVYFVATDGITGSELWKTDGTEPGTVMVKDITSGTGSTSFSLMTAGNGLVFFVANDGVSGSELWRSDGTEAGTYLLKDINPGSASSAINRIFFHNGLLFFGADNGTHGQELWKSDGTTAGTVMIKDINPGATASSPAPLSNASYTFVALGNEVFFAALDPAAGRELYKTDGTEAGTVLVKDVWPGGAGGIGVTNHKAAVHNGKLYFAGNDGVNGVELWSTDGTEAGTFMVKDIVAGSGHSHPSNLISFNGALFFSASTVNNGNPNLYKTDGTEGGTVLVRDLVADGIILNIGNSATINDFTIAAGKLFFRSNSSLNGFELFVSDGTTGGTGLVKDIVPGIGNSGPNGLFEMNGKLYFSALDPALQRTILFSSDGTEAGTMGIFEGELRDVLGVSSSPFISTGPKFFFWGSTQDGIELWSTDGTSAGTAMVRNINTAITGTPNFHTSPQSSIEMNGYSYFAAGSPDHGIELWKSNGTTAGTAMVKDIWPGKGPSSPQNLFKHGGYIYFSANDGTHGTELWRTDGTQAGTVMIKDINPGNAGSNLVRFTLSNNYLYFTAYTASNGQELWRTDGTEAGTVLVLDLVSGPVSGMTGIAEGITLNDEAYLIAGIGAGNSLGMASGTKLIKVNGATNTISELSSIISFAQDITLSGNTLYIGGRNAANQTILWKSVNGGAVEQVKLLSNTAVTVFQLTDCGGKLYFSASDGSSGLEPWVSDGSEAGTFMLKDINPGAGNSNPYQYVLSGGKVFFTATSFSATGVNNAEIYITDGTVAGTYLFKDIQPGVQGSRPSGGAMIEYPANKLLFTATDGVSGTELWQSDGTSEGTTLLQDFNSGSGDGFNFPGILINFPTEHVLNRVGDGLIFFARNAVTGFQLYGGSLAATYYVNDNSQTGDVFTTAVGNDANTGTASAPFATLAYAVAQAKNGDTIYVDAGTYITPDITINKGITILGANHLLSPNDASDPLQPNAGRNAESVISNCAITIGAANVTIRGFTFDPQSKNQLRQTHTTQDFDNITVSGNIFQITSGATVINMTGQQVNPLVTTNYQITDNRFIKQGSAIGSSISLAAVNGILIEKNTFTVSTVAATRTQNGYLGGTFRTDNMVITNNAAYQQRFVFQNPNALKARIDFNKAIECERFVLDFNSIVDPCNIDISDNLVTNPKTTGGPVISYARSNGVILSSPNRARIERNTITLDATGLASVAQALIAPTLDNASLNTQVYIRENILKISGDFSSQSSPNLYVSAIRFLNNSRQAVVENNDIEFTGVNNGIVNKFGIGVLHSGLQPDASFHFTGNKISGFPTSIGMSPLPAGVTMNIHYNSFTNDGMCINNANAGEPVNASCNWYGSAAAQNFINKISFSKVDIIPWLTNGTDADPATGFQPVTGACDGYPTLITLDNYSDVTCNGAANGTINITASYGKSPFTFTWTREGDPGFVSHDEDPTNLSPGTYHLAVVDGNGSNIYITHIEAEGPETITVTITEPPVLTASATGTHVSCFNGSNGTASVNESGGTAPYTYLWNNSATTSSISNLPAAIYSVTVTDDNGCTAQASYEVTQPTLLTASIANNSTACANIATVAANGGTPGYSYLWSNGATTATISNVPAGNYNVVVTDANGCTVSASIALTVSEAFNPSASVTGVSCFGGSNGVITVTNANGTAPFTFSIDGINFVPGTLPYSFTGLAAGTYTVAVRDVNGCTGFVTKTISQPAQLLVTINNVQSSCFGQNNGSISASVSGGSPAYTYQWTGPNGYSSTQLSISSLAAGNYSLTVTDKKSCTVIQPVTVPSRNEIVVSAWVTHVLCKGDANGAIDLTVSGGTGSGFTYLWNNGATTEDRFNLTSGNYSVAITDIGSGCVVNRSYSISQPATSVAISVSRTHVTGCSNLGSITASGSGGTPPYQYSIDGTQFQSSGLFTGLFGGNYTVWVKDANGCTKTAATNINDNGTDEFESNNSKNKAKTIQAGNTYMARIALATDPADWFVFTTTAAGMYTLTFTHPSATFAFDLYPGGNSNTALVPVNATATAKEYNLAANTSYYIGITGGLSYICYQFSVTTSLITRSSGAYTVQEAGVAGKADFDVKVFGNPSATRFELQVLSDNDESIILKITDVNGRVMEMRHGILPNQMIRFGEKYRAGIYFAEIIQGSKRKSVKLLKM